MENTTVGRPRLIESPEKAEELITKMFADLKEDEIPTVEDLVIALGLASRQSLKEYEDRKEFSDTIKNAKLRIFNKQKKLAMGNKLNPTIFIFNAKNNHGHSDKTEVETKNDNTLTIKREIVKR